ncbi:TetR/AcrR family transcriptional regulator [Frigoribacterium sp. 2-23]|uniref:TetR/AcrR family transcriptional regulator n=1 Tax=Frigoribacterium sp. 2-23 TaxID=3415006 RepID=UPI003C6EDF73
MPTSTDERPGLRERKRQATLTAIQRAAIDLSLELGYDAVTVDMICERCEISAKTFFNYVGSKENAVLGPDDDGLDDADLDAFVSVDHDDVVEALVSLIVRVALASDDGSARDRHRAIVDSPELMQHQLRRIDTAEARMQAVVCRWMAAHPGRLPEPPHGATTDDQARMVVLFVGSVLRFSIPRLFDAPPGADAEQILRDCLGVYRSLRP